MPVNFRNTVFMRIAHKKEPVKFSHCSNNNFLCEIQHYLHLGGSGSITILVFISTLIRYLAMQIGNISFPIGALRRFAPVVAFLAYKLVLLPIVKGITDADQKH